MADTTNTLLPESREPTPSWGWLLALGIIFIIMGFIGLGLVIGLTIVTMIFFGAFLIVAGIANLIYVARDKEWKGIIWHAVIAIFYLIAGGIIIYDPIFASTIVTAFLAGIFIAIGITRLIMAFSRKFGSGFLWLILAGIASLILGIIILAQWPVSGLWFIGLFIAIEMIVTGWSYIALAFDLKRAS